MMMGVSVFWRFTSILWCFQIDGKRNHGITNLSISSPSSSSSLRIPWCPQSQDSVNGRKKNLFQSSFYHRFLFPSLFKLKVGYDETKKEIQSKATRNTKRISMEHSLFLSQTLNSKIIMNEEMVESVNFILIITIISFSSYNSFLRGTNCEKKQSWNMRICNQTFKKCEQEKVKFQFFFENCLSSY